MDTKVEDIVQNRSSPVIFKFYDCTPVRMGFGKLQALLMPHACYPILLNNK